MPSLQTSTSLLRSLLDPKCFYKIRMESAYALASVNNPMDFMLIYDGSYTSILVCTSEYRLGWSFAIEQNVLHTLLFSKFLASYGH